MSYQSGSFVADEQPTTAKWNLLWGNDASFNDGTGIGDNAILNRHLSDGIVTADELDLDPAADYVATRQSTTSTSYTDLATAGPDVTVDIGANGLALVFLYAQISSTTVSAICYMGFAISGASTVAADDSQAAVRRPHDNAEAGIASHGASLLVTGLTPGSTTFTTKYRVNTGTGFFQTRRIAVVPL